MTTAKRTGSGECTSSEQATWEDDNILFVVGAARSGTTYLTDTLDEQFGFGMSPEGHFVVSFARRISRYGDLSREPNMMRLLEDLRNASTLRIIREEWPPHRRFDVSAAEIRERVDRTDFAAVVFAVFRTIADKLSKPHVGTKNPGYTTCLPLLESMFAGRARYINIVRDGRDVAVSTMRQPWGQRNAYACARVWNRHLDLAAAFAHQVGPSRFLSLRYEDLVGAPEATLDGIEAFLGIGVEPDSRQRFLDAAGASGYAENFGKWSDALSRRDIERFEAVASRNLRLWGYEPCFESPSVGIAERGMLEAGELLRKARVTLLGAAR